MPTFSELIISGLNWRNRLSCSTIYWSINIIWWNTILFHPKFQWLQYRTAFIPCQVKAYSILSLVMRIFFKWMFISSCFNLHRFSFVVEARRKLWTWYLYQLIFLVLTFLAYLTFSLNFIDVVRSNLSVYILLAYIEST